MTAPSYAIVPHDNADTFCAASLRGVPSLYYCLRLANATHFAGEKVDAGLKKAMHVPKGYLPKNGSESVINYAAVEFVVVDVFCVIAASACRTQSTSDFWGVANAADARQRRYGSLSHGS